MLIDVVMPALSAEMEEGAIACWRVAAGDRILSGEIMAEIETDKATVDLESPADGVVAELLVAEGEAGVKVASVIARIAPDGSAHPGERA